MVLAIFRLSFSVEEDAEWSSGLHTGLPIERSGVRFPPAPLGKLVYDVYTDRTHCRWEDEPAREITSHPPSQRGRIQATHPLMLLLRKLLTFHAHGCLRDSLRHCSSSFS